MRDDWERKSIGEFLALQRGYDLTAEERKHGTVPVMGAAGQNGFHSEALARAPGIVIGRSGGSFGQVHFSPNDFWPHNTAMFVTDFKGNDPKFAFYFLRNLNFSKLNSGSAQPSLNRNYVYPLRICVPRPEEQKRIAEVLSTLDAKIDLNNRISVELETLAKTVYDHWFVQFDFPDKNGRPYKASGGKMVYNATLKREIPRGWEARSLASIVNVSTAAIDPASQPERVFRHMSIPSFDETGSFIEENGGAIGSNKFVVSPFDLLVSKLNPWFNRVVADTGHEDMICSTEFVVWRCRDRNAQAFLETVARHDHFITYCTQSVGSTSGSHSRVNPQVMMRYVVPYSEEHVLQYGKRAAPLLERRGLNTRETRDLTQLRDWLLPMLMNGQIKVGRARQLA